MANKRKFKIVKNNGQIIIGDGNCQLTLNGVSGGVVNILAPQQKPKITERSFPIASLPKPFNRLIGRGPEKQQALENLRFEQSVEFYGEEGIGKSVLVKALFPQIQLTSLFSDKIVYISSKNKKLSEIKQFLFDCFYETNLNYRVTDFEFANRFKDKKALIILDDIQVSRHDLEDLMNAAPLCTFLITTRQRNIWVDGISQFISGLSASESLQLIAKEIGRALTDSELAPAKFISETFRGNPLKILQRVARAKTENVPLAHLAAELELSLEAPLEHAAQKDGRGYRLILGLLAAFSSLAASARTLAEASGETIQTVNQTLEELRLLHLVEFEENRYRLAENFSEYLAETWPLNTYRERLLQFYLEWVQQYASRGDVLLEELEAITSVVNWAAEGGYYAEAIALGQAVEPVVALEGQWGVWESLLDNILNSAIYGQDISTESWALHQLGTRALCLGENPSAISFLTRALELRQLEGNAAAIEVTQHNLNLLIGGGGSDSGEPEPEEQWTGDPQSSSTSEQPWHSPSPPTPPTTPYPQSTPPTTSTFPKALPGSKVATLLLVGLGSGIGLGAAVTSHNQVSSELPPTTQGDEEIQPSNTSEELKANVSAPENESKPNFSKPPSHDGSLIARDSKYDIPRDTATVINPVENDESSWNSHYLNHFEQPKNGTLEHLKEAGLTYTPDPGFTGYDEFTYRITDGEKEAEAMVSLKVVGSQPVAIQPNAPKSVLIAKNSSYTVDAGKATVINPMENDESSWNSHYLKHFEQPKNGTLDHLSEAGLTYIPNPGFTGDDEFTYRITDGEKEAEATVSLKVEGTSHPPQLPPSSKNLLEYPLPEPLPLIAQNYDDKKIEFQQDGNSCDAKDISFSIDAAEGSDKNFFIDKVEQPDLGTVKQEGTKNLSYTVTLDEIRERRSASGQSRQVQVVVFTRVTSPPQGDLALLAPSGESPAVNEPTIDDFSETVQFNYVISNGETQDKGTITVEVFAPADCFSTSSSLI
ncbi:MAG: hypothetical protein EA342_07445 [Leptolyngbya sp. LCM1.Bin17]|nr:MAG: hypothetical protein EA342_07445 [Leptolyngbya sp. LCM1.Bin17]